MVAGRTAAACSPTADADFATRTWRQLRPRATAERKRLLRKALLRWHPDKWATVLPRVAAADRSVIADRLSVVTQAIVQQKKALV